jgi:hypothetical protein
MDEKETGKAKARLRRSGAELIMADVELAFTFLEVARTSSNLKFRIPTCIEPNHAQIPMRMEAGFQVFTFSIEISRRLQALNSPAGSLTDNYVKYNTDQRFHGSQTFSLGTISRVWLTAYRANCRIWRDNAGFHSSRPHSGSADKVLLAANLHMAAPYSLTR